MSLQLISSPPSDSLPVWHNFSLDWFSEMLLFETILTAFFCDVFIWMAFFQRFSKIIYRSAEWSYILPMPNWVHNQFRNGNLNRCFLQRQRQIRVLHSWGKHSIEIEKIAKFNQTPVKIRFINSNCFKSAVKTSVSMNKFKTNPNQSIFV